VIEEGGVLCRPPHGSGPRSETQPGRERPGARSRACAWGSLTSWLRASETACIARHLSVAIEARVAARFQTARVLTTAPVAVAAPQMRDWRMQTTRISWTRPPVRATRA